MCTIKNGRSNVEFPTSVGVGNVGEVHSASTCAWVNGPRQGISGLEVEVSPYAAVNLRLQRVVVGVRSSKRHDDGAVARISKNSALRNSTRAYRTIRATLGCVQVRQLVLWREVNVLTIALEPVLVAYVGNREHSVGANLLLYAGTVLIASRHFVLLRDTRDTADQNWACGQVDCV